MHLRKLAGPPLEALVLTCFLLILSASPADESEESNDGGAEKKEKKSYAESIEDCDTRPGLFPIHQDRETGRILLEIAPGQISEADSRKEFIHFSHTLDGVPSLGLFRGQFGSEKVFTIRRHFDRIEFVEENVSFHFHPESPLRRASRANISEAVLASEEIVAEHEADGRILIEADSIFLDELFRQLKPGKRKDDKEERFRLGDLSEERTRFLESKSFEDNTLFRVQYVFENLHPSETGEEDVTDSRFVTIKVQHTLIAMPENDYAPRFDDPRVGYFTTRVTDLTSKSSAPYRDLVHRWHLVKQDPAAELSPPVEPITWWIENTTPTELRETIREASLRWNRAFESAGFRDAIEVKVQPDDAEWDADDINYHVLRWTSSPDPPFGGYGPSFVNPRTGQILGADIMLEYVFLTNRVRFREIVELGRPERENSPLSLPGAGRHFCTYRDCLHSNRIAGTAILAARSGRFDNGPIETDELIRQALTDLILHEIGHTLGLNHNFRASHLYDREEIQDKERTSETGLTGSVMDYSPINLSRDPEAQGHYYSVAPGPYDHWAIRFGYDDPGKREAILSESTRREHAFANDADDMRRAGRGIDPRAMINDLTSEPIAHSGDRIEMVKETLPDLVTAFPVEGESYHELRTAFSSLMREWHRAAETLSRFIGGIEVERALEGQEGAPEAPFRPVPEDVQVEALEQLDRHVLGPGAVEFPPPLLAHLQLQRRGFEFFELEDNEDPKIHRRVRDMQEDVLDHLLHRHTLTRIIDSSAYGNRYSLEEFMTDLDAIILTGDPEGSAGSFREALQLAYVERLIEISGLEETSDFPPAARSQAVYLLQQRIAAPEALPSLPERHRTHLLLRMRNALAPR